MAPPRSREGPPIALEAVGWLGRYLTDEQRVVQVVGVQAVGLDCEDIVTGVKVFVEFDETTGGVHWRDVTPNQGETA